MTNTFSNPLRIAGAGPIPIIFGSTPATEYPTILANGCKPFSFAFSSLINTKTALPSFRPDAFPAVTEPSLRKAGFNPANFSAVISARGCSSFENTTSFYVLLS